MSGKIERIPFACNLPETWDRLAIDCFQKKSFLEYAEQYNPCNQRYYMVVWDDVPVIGCIVYTLRVDVLTYLSIPSSVKTQIIGIPCSVSASGILGDLKLAPILMEYIEKHERGLLIALNLPLAAAPANGAIGRTLPTIEMENQFESWEGYLEVLRASYRRRFVLLSRPFEAICVKKLDCAKFDEEMYFLYCEVLNRTKGKLETLTIEFFQHLPNSFNLTAYYELESLIGWHISTTYQNKFYFFLGGIDYQKNKQYNTYFNILYSVLREGIESRANIIDLGQTAEIPKTRLGGKVIEKYMFGTHSNWLVRDMLRIGKAFLEYSVSVPAHRVFREML